MDSVKGRRDPSALSHSFAMSSDCATVMERMRKDCDNFVQERCKRLQDERIRKDPACCGTPSAVVQGRMSLTQIAECSDVILRHAKIAGGRFEDSALLLFPEALDGSDNSLEEL